MNFKILQFFIFIFFLFGCEKNISSKKINQDLQVKYKNSGFTLIYSDDLKNQKKISKKMDNRSLFIFHKNLKKNSLVKITNPKNNKTIIAEVISNNIKFSNFYNSVISLRIAEELSLDFKEPYIDLVLIYRNSTYVAKKAKTFDEEKKVAQKAPVDGILIDNLSTSNQLKEASVKKINFKYSIKIADFYYSQSAKNMTEKIINETHIKNPIIKKLSNTKYRVLIGPFDDIKTLEESFNEIESLNFENLEIIENV